MCVVAEQHNYLEARHLGLLPEEDDEEEEY
jgi:hypothetical protein